MATEDTAVQLATLQREAKAAIGAFFERKKPKPSA